MITEKELKDQCTHEFYNFIYKLCGKDYLPLYSSELNFEIIHFPLLIHRAFEGFKNKNLSCENNIIICNRFITYFINDQGGIYDFRNYQPENLTQFECAILHCLIDVFGEKSN
jgi:hypothetical protein